MNAGDRCFLMHGQEVEYVAPYADGHVVRRLLLVVDSDGEEQEVRGSLDEVDEVFAQPPRVKFDEYIASVQKRITELRAECAEAQALRDEAKADASAMRARLAQHEALKRIDDYLEGRFEWVVTDVNSTLKVEKISDAFAYRDGYDRGLKLVTLFGESKRDLQWRINDYRDGSGSWGRMWPCATEDEAKAKASSIFMAEVEEWRKKCASDKGADVWTKARSWASEPRPDWMVVPQDFADYVRASRVRQARENVERAEKSAAEARAALAKAEGTA